MSDFAWLEKIIAARTPGSWRALGDPFKASTAKAICPVKVIGRMHGYPTVEPSDAEFIATMGTLADKMMAVIDAVSPVVDHRLMHPHPIYEKSATAGSFWPMMKRLRDARDALQAARKDVE